LIRLPKNTLDHPRLAALEAYLAQNEGPLRDGSATIVTRFAVTDAWKAAMQAAARTGHVSQGLESIQKTLDREQKGLKAVQEKTKQAPTTRLSRLLIFANDGSERFYRDAEFILKHHGDRAWGCLVDIDSEALGAVYTPKGKPTKALMIGDRDAVGQFLNALATGLP